MICVLNNVLISCIHTIASTPPPSSSNSIALGVGIGVGVGVPIVLAVILVIVGVVYCKGQSNSATILCFHALTSVVLFFPPCTRPLNPDP